MRTGLWCQGGLEPHTLRRYHLKVVRLPIPPPGLCPEISASVFFRLGRLVLLVAVLVAGAGAAVAGAGLSPPSAAGARRRRHVTACGAAGAFGAAVSTPLITPRSSLGLLTRALLRKFPCPGSAGKTGRPARRCCATETSSRRARRIPCRMHRRRSRNRQPHRPALQQDQDDHAQCDEHINHIENSQQHFSIQSIHLCAAAQMARKSSAISEAPPIRPPSTSAWANSSAALAALTLPP